MIRLGVGMILDSILCCTVAEPHTTRRRTIQTRSIQTRWVAELSQQCAHCGNGTSVEDLTEDLFASSRKRARGSAPSPALATAAHLAAEGPFHDEETLLQAGGLDFSVDMSNIDMGDLPADVTAEQKFLV